MYENDKANILNQMMRINKKIFSKSFNSGGSHKRGKHGWGRGQIHMVQVIAENPKISQEELAKILMVDKTTIAKAIKKLEIHGLITREKSQEDGRKYELTATEKALHFNDGFKKKIDDTSDDIFNGLTDDDLLHYKKILSHIEDNICISKGRNNIHD